MSYKSKSDDSFNSNLKFYLFKKVIENKTETIELEDFLSFSIENEISLIDLYTTRYLKYYSHEKIANEFDKTVDQIYKEIKVLSENLKVSLTLWKQEYFQKIFQNKLPKESYDQLINSKKCHYCQADESAFKALFNSHQIKTKRARGFNFEIDRLDPNKDYSVDNCVSSCYWCNNAKTDEFSEEEFKPVGNAIREVWLKRLNKQ
jgi:hypothetical protein